LNRERLRGPSGVADDEFVRVASPRGIVGEVRPDPPGMVLLETAFGGSRVVDMLAGDPLPRIC
jgi:hydrogenase expression/formation protein HypE